MKGSMRDGITLVVQFTHSRCFLPWRSTTGSPVSVAWIALDKLESSGSVEGSAVCVSPPPANTYLPFALGTCAWVSPRRPGSDTSFSRPRFKCFV